MVGKAAKCDRKALSLSIPVIAVSKAVEDAGEEPNIIHSEQTQYSLSHGFDDNVRSMTEEYMITHICFRANVSLPFVKTEPGKIAPTY